MPAFNADHYIEEAIQSVISQTINTWELIIIDDCSTDRTSEIARNYATIHSNIRYYNNPQNLGVAESRNRGISLSTGEWIAFLDSDDCWHPQKLESQLSYAKKHGVDFVFTGSSFINENSEPLNYYLSVPTTVCYRELLKQNIISCSSVLIQRELILQYPMKQASKMHEDFAVWLQILRDKNRCAYGIDKPLLIYRISSTSKSGNKIKAGIMTYQVYRYLDIHTIPALYYWICYTIRSLKKYRNLIG